MSFTTSLGFQIIDQWLLKHQKPPFKFQKETWDYISDGYSGIVNAPTGCGKTYSVFLGTLIKYINTHKDYETRKNLGLRLLWITPLRALAKDIGRAMEEVISGIGLPWRVGIRNGDTPMMVRQQQRKNMPEILITTPETLHLMLALKRYPSLFSSLEVMAIDEWHELLGSKRGVQTELAISRLVALRREARPDTDLQLWGISATIGNLEQASDILLSPLKQGHQIPKIIIVKAEIEKKIKIQSVFPKEIETYPWAGHLGLKLIGSVIKVIMKSRTTLLFINTRRMAEVWYQSILSIHPDLAGLIALHHGSIERETRDWVEENLHAGNLKVVVCTSSLDLGVDFRPVETVIQVGSPKSVARFMQRAGRSGHGPGEVSKIYFVPTHSLELAEASAFKEAARLHIIEAREPMLLCFDVLIQFLATLALSEGFEKEKTFEEVKSTYCFAEITPEEFDSCVSFLVEGGHALTSYDEYKKVVLVDGLYRITDRRIGRRHRMHIGTIVSEPMMRVKMISGKFLGVIEEYFISKLKPGDVFTLAGRTVELTMVKGLTAIVRKSNSKKSIIPSWQGGRMSLSTNLGHFLRKQIHLAATTKKGLPEELLRLKPLFDLQSYLSYIPAENEILIEKIETEDGYHVFVYPFEGRLVHEAMSALAAYRLSLITPMTFSMAMNDYGFELLSDQPVPLDDKNVKSIFEPAYLQRDIASSLNSIEMAKRKFRDIATIGGLIFQGYPGAEKKARHLQSSAGLLFDVISEYEPDSLLIRQAYHEAMEQQMEEARLMATLSRIQHSKIVITYPRRLTPFCFPIKVDSMRENLTSEKLEDRVRKMVGGEGGY